MLTRGFLIAALFFTVAPQTEPRFPVHVECLEYPPLARQARIGGDVAFIAKVDADGRVIGSPAKLTGHPILQQVASTNLEHWRFQAGANSEVKVTYHFKVEGKPMDYPTSACEFDLPDSVTIMTRPGTPQPDAQAQPMPRSK